MLTDYQQNIIEAKICPYCKSKTRVTTEVEIYGKEYKGNSIICCENFPKCDSFVGTHKDGKALGRLANKELRSAKILAHYHFDKIWKDELVDRSELYKLLSEFLKTPKDLTHIGMFQTETCLKVAKWAQNFYITLTTENKNHGI